MKKRKTTLRIENRKYVAYQFLGFICLYTWNAIIVFKYVKLNNMLSYPCLIFIYYHPYLFVV
jgi:hypothetical protein